MRKIKYVILIMLVTISCYSVNISRDRAYNRTIEIVEKVYGVKLLRKNIGLIYKKDYIELVAMQDEYMYELRLDKNANVLNMDRLEVHGY